MTVVDVHIPIFIVPSLSSRSWIVDSIGEVASVSEGLREACDKLAVRANPVIVLNAKSIRLVN